MADTGELTSSSGSFTVTDTKVGFAQYPFCRQRSALYTSCVPPV